jgi:hypothetical protein
MRVSAEVGADQERRHAEETTNATIHSVQAFAEAAMEPEGWEY